MANIASGTHALTFQNTHFSVVDRNSQPWLRSSEIAQALGYSDASAINRIYARNRNEFTDAMTGSVKLTDPNGDLQETRIFSLRGAHLIAMFARTANAAAFRRWVLDILDREAAAQPQAFDWQAAIQQLPHTPANIPAATQIAINRRAWLLAGESYELLRSYLTQRVTHHCAYGTLPKINEAEAIAIIEQTTLDMAIAPAHYHAINLPLNALKLAATATQTQLEALQKLMNRESAA